MKTLLKLVPFALFAGTFFFTTSLFAQQRISATLNVSQFNIDRVQSDVADIDYAGSTSASVNFRYYTKNQFAYRLGMGIDNLNYEVGGGVITDYSAKRTDLKGIFGLEKHFNIGNSLDIYPGVFIPVIVTGDDIISDNLSNITNGSARAGLGLILGANIKLLKFLRLGVEFDAQYDNFKNQVWESAETLSLAPIKGINYNTSITLGVAF